VDTDILVVGGGIAGLSFAAFAAQRARVTLVEAEPILTYHTTGRSAALFSECFVSDPMFRAARASRAFLVESDEPLGTQRPLLFVAPTEDRSALDDLESAYAPKVPSLERIGPDEVHELIAVIPHAGTTGGLLEPGAMELDVHALVTQFTRMIRTGDGTIITRAPLLALEELPDGWSATVGDATLTAGVVVNAAGAWGNEVAALAHVDPLPLTPLKRSAFTFDPGVPSSGWPFVIDVLERWYLKPEGPYALGSAASEIPVEAHDARPDEIDVAMGIDRIMSATTLTIRSVRNQWAGIRTFTPDRLPAIGFEPGNDRFFWLVGQGGAGLLTSPAFGALAAALALGDGPPHSLRGVGLTGEEFDPRRFRETTPEPARPSRVAPAPPSGSAYGGASRLSGV
jgi:D-arginine dehydrogenase